MPETLEVIPDPVSLIESMRAVGYTVETAVADLVDNSISADSTRVQIEYDASDDPFVAILDNGNGMAPDELTNAMRHGSRNPTDVRASHDLGRFGLGLKTASLSQCQKLTVLSKKGGHIHARCWDLDFVRAENKWIVIVPDQAEQERLPLYRQLSSQVSGTLVVWQSLDRLMSESSKPQDEMKIRMSYLHDHLALVFHRFTQRENNFPMMEIFINGVKVAPKDPFLKANNFRQPLEGQNIGIRGAIIHVKPYILPPISHLTQDQIEMAGGKNGLRGSQGFYIYRNRRLVIWGTWFRLVPKDEFFKLTRVQVDIPNSLDDLWALDIKKSAAYPPDVIRNRLKDLIPHFANTSRKTITYPGRKQKDTNFTPLWQRIEPRQGLFRYEINTEHAAIIGLSEAWGAKDKKHFQALLELLATSIPFESIYADMCSDHKQSDNGERAKELVAMAANLLEITGLNMTTILNIDPIARFPQYHARIREELAQ